MLFRFPSNSSKKVLPHVPAPDDIKAAKILPSQAKEIPASRKFINFSNMSFSSTVLHNQPIPVKALDVQIFRSDPEKQMVTGASHPVWNSFIIAGIKLKQ